MEEIGYICNVAAGAGYLLSAKSAAEGRSISGTLYLVKISDLAYYSN